MSFWQQSNKLQPRGNVSVLLSEEELEADLDSVNSEDLAIHYRVSARSKCFRLVWVSHKSSHETEIE